MIWPGECAIFFGALFALAIRFRSRTINHFALRNFGVFVRVGLRNEFAGNRAPAYWYFFHGVAP